MVWPPRLLSRRFALALARSAGPSARRADPRRGSYREDVVDLGRAGRGRCRTGSSPQRNAPTRSLGYPSGPTGNLAEPLIHGAAYFDRLVDEVEALGAGDHLFFTDWRGDPDQRLRAGRPHRGPALRAGRPTRRGGQGADLALPPRRAGLQRGGEPRPQRDDLRRRRRGAARPAGPARRLAPPEAGGAAPPGRARSGTSRSSAGSTCATAAATTPTHHGDPQPVQMSPRYGPASALARRAARGARAGGRRAGHHVPGALDRPDAAGLGEPAGLPAGPAARRRPAPRPAAARSRPTRRPAVRTGVQVLRTYPGVRPATRSPRTASAPWPAATPRRSAGPAG